MRTSLHWGWLGRQLRWIGLAGLLIYFLVAGGTYNGGTLYSLQRANFFIFLLAAVAWQVWRIWHKRPFHATWLDKWLVLWLAAILLAALFSAQWRLSLDNLIQQLIYVMVFYLVTDVVRAGPPQALRGLPHAPRGQPAEDWHRALLWSSVAVIAFGIFEWLVWYSDWISISGWQEPIPPATFRVRASLGHANILAAYLNLMLPLGLILALRKGWRRLAAIIWALAALALIFGTSSRGGWLGSAAAISALALLLGVDHRAWLREKWARLRNRRFLLAGLILTVLAISAIAIGLLMRQAQHPTHPQGDPRGYIWSVALDMFRRDPWTGVGPGTFGLEFQRRFSIPPDMLLAHAHNFALNTLGEMGLIGALALLGLAYGVVLLAWHAWRSAQGEQRAWVSALIASLAGLAVHSLFDTPETVTVISLLAAVILGLLAAQSAPVSPSRSPRVRWMVTWAPAMRLAVTFALWGWSLTGYGMYDQGLRAARAGDWQTAAERLDETARHDPGLAYYWAQAGFAHGMLALDGEGAVRDGVELQAALDAYERALELDDSYSLDWLNLGWLREQAGDMPGAMAAYQRAAELVVKSADVTRFYGQKLAQQGRSDEAAEMFAREADLLAAGANLAPGWQALRAGDAQGAAEVFTANLGLNTAEAYLGLGMALTQTGDYPAAERALRTARFAEADELLFVEALEELYTLSGEEELAAQAAARAEYLRDRASVFGTGELGQSATAWYVYHRESLPLELLPGLFQYPNGEGE